MFQFTVFTALSILLLPALVASMPSAHPLEKRITHTGRGTWFNVGLGACGETNVNSDKIVALSTAVFDNRVHCNKEVAITVHGKTEYAAVRDECPGCGKYDLDMSPGLFEGFANPDVGVVEVSWHFT